MLTVSKFMFLVANHLVLAESVSRSNSCRTRCILIENEENGLDDDWKDVLLCTCSAENVMPPEIM